MVTLLLLVWDIGVRTSLEDCNFLSSACFDIGSGKVARVFIFLAGPNVINLTFHQYRRMECVAYFPCGQSQLFRIHSYAAREIISTLGCVNCLCRFSRNIVHDGVVFSSYDRKVRALCRTWTVMVRRCVCLDDVFVQKGGCREHVSSIKCSLFVIRSEKGYVCRRSDMQCTGVHFLRVDGIADISACSHRRAGVIGQHITGVDRYKASYSRSNRNCFLVTGVRVDDRHFAVLTGRNRQRQTQFVVRILIRLQKGNPEIFTFR